MKHRAGFTLIEAIVGVGITIAVMSIIYSIMTNSFKSYTLISTNNRLQLTGDVALERIRREVNQALNVEASHSTYTTGNTTLVVRLAGISSAGIILPSTYDYVVYTHSAASQKLTEITFADAASSRKSNSRAIGTDVIGATFTYYDATGALLSSNYATAKRVTISFSASETHNLKTITKNYTLPITLRNK